VTPRNWPLWVGTLAFGLLAFFACKSDKTGDQLVERAAFGVFFGGQIQDRTELPFELDPTKQRIGIRIDFRAPLASTVPVTWEIARPLAGKAKKGDSAADHVVEVGEAAARVGEARLDVPLSLRQGQGLGTWHVRVKVDGRQVIDRDVLVEGPRDRREREADAGH
jgi:hypothetical protein